MRRLALGSLLVAFACFNEDKPNVSSTTGSSSTSGTSSSGTTTGTSTSESSTGTPADSSTGPMDCPRADCAGCLACAIVASCDPIYEECKASEDCAPVIGCAMGCWAEDDAEACFAATCHCGATELADAMLACIADHCGDCISLAC